MRGRRTIRRPPFSCGAGGEDGGTARGERGETQRGTTDWRQSSWVVGETRVVAARPVAPPRAPRHGETSVRRSLGSAPPSSRRAGGCRARPAGADHPCSRPHRAAARSRARPSGWAGSRRAARPLRCRSAAPAPVDPSDGEAAAARSVRQLTGRAPKPQRGRPALHVGPRSDSPNAHRLGAYGGVEYFCQEVPLTYGSRRCSASYSSLILPPPVQDPG